MWSRSDLWNALTRPLVQKKQRTSDHLSPMSLQLRFEELIAMRGRRSGFGRPQQIDGFRLGDLASRRRGTGLELDSIGPYQWGDDIRHMDWFATARTGRLQVKQFRRDVQQTVLLVIDLRPHMMFGSGCQLMAKTACLSAAKIAWATSKDHQPLGVLLVDGTRVEFVPARRGRRARLLILKRLVQAYGSAINHAGNLSPPLAEGLATLPRYMAGDVEAVIISDFSHLGDDVDRRLREVGAKGAQSAIVIEDDLMTDPPPAGLYPVRQGRSDAVATMAIRKRDAAAYRKETDRHRRALAARLSSLGMRQILVSDPRSIREGYFR